MTQFVKTTFPHVKQQHLQRQLQLTANSLTLSLTLAQIHLYLSLAICICVCAASFPVGIFCLPGLSPATHCALIMSVPAIAALLTSSCCCICGRIYFGRNKLVAYWRAAVRPWVAGRALPCSARKYCTPLISKAS